MIEAKKDNDNIHDAIIQDVGNAIKGINNGLITISIKDSKIVQIEVNKTKQYFDIWEIEEGGGI